MGSCRVIIKKNNKESTVESGDCGGFRDITWVVNWSAVFVETVVRDFKIQ